VAKETEQGGSNVPAVTLPPSVTWENVSPEDEPAKSKWVAGIGVPMKGWPRYLLSVLLLVYTLYVAKAVYEDSRGAKAVAGYMILAAFAVCYLVALPLIEKASPLEFWALFGLLVVLFVAELPFAQAEAFELGVYITLIAVARLGARSWPIVVVLTLGAIFLPAAYPPWHDSLTTGFDNALAVAIPIIALTTFGIMRWHQGSRALVEARAELARLAERARIARDMHDLLGHSLTTITVKAQLASRLGESDPARARHEMAEVEAIARSSLADVRAAVSNYHITLAGELASGRELLRAAGINADLPGAVDVVDPANQELFGWVVREGLTNIVRHAHATSCAVRLSASSVEVLDDGVGVNSPRSNEATGNGLAGLRDRVAAAGGIVDAGPREPRGWRLVVSLAPQAGA
jgi:two-component system, NarL family, sensor histidine kinase DesK